MRSLDLLTQQSLFSLLHRIDLNLARQRIPVAYCQGPLHYSNYLRKMRGGGPLDLELFFELRYNLSCGREGYSWRVKPPSVRFWGRRVYWAPVVLLLTALRQGRNPEASLERLKGICGVWRSTVNRWRDYFLEFFPDSYAWHRLSEHFLKKNEVNGSSGSRPWALLQSTRIFIFLFLMNRTK